MKTIGMIGGMSWESTSQYYRIMNQYVQTRLGGHNSVECIIYSVNFERVLELVERNEWHLIVKMVAEVAKKLEAAGADFILMTSNAVHKVFDEVQKIVSVPILHIFDPTGKAVQASRIGTVGLLGTKVTMEEPFIRDRLRDRYQVETIIPEKKDRDRLHKIIFDELTVGRITKPSKKALIEIIHSLSERGAGGVILGCTELTLLIAQEDTPVRLFDTTDLHAKAAVDEALRLSL